MRVHPWIVSVLSVMALTVGQNGFAQYESGGMPGSGEAEGPYAPVGQFAPGGPGYSGEGFVPPPPPAPAGAWDPIAAGQNGGPGSHPARSPWPHISPFENRFAEYYHEDNELWFFRSNNSDRRYYADIDYRRTDYRRPDVTRVGADVAPQNFTDAGTGPFLPVDTGVFFSSFLGNFNGLPSRTQQGGGGQQNQVLTVDNVQVNEQALGEKQTVNGFQITWGFREPSEEGFDISGWYTPEAHWAYSRGYNASRVEVQTLAAFNIGKPPVVAHALPIYDGLPDGINGRVDGDYILYDRFFGLDFESVGGGGELNWNFTPFWRSDWYKFGTTMGLNMMYIGESFAFNGADSGGVYDIIIPPGFADPSTYVQAVAPYESHIQSDVQSYLFGPQIGLRFEVGGDNLKILGHSQVGLSMNHERLQLSSFGVGNGFGGFFDQTTIFNEDQHHTRLSPTTAQQLMLEAKIFHYIPIVRKFHFLEEAKFRFGYQINAAFEIQRPHRIIEYNGFPLIPAIRNDQETRWYAESWNFGVHWTY